MGIKVRDIEKGPNEIIRIEVSRYKGNILINIRVWFKRSMDSEFKPTGKGVAINVNLYPELKQAINEVEKVLKDIKSGVIHLEEEG